MNTELIKKYQEEFLHHINGGDIVVKFDDTWYVADNTTKAWSQNLQAVVYYDDYVELRIALSDGEQLEYLDHGTWSTAVGATANGTFTLPVESYRINEEPAFKPTDTVVCWNDDHEDSVLITTYQETILHIYDNIKLSPISIEELKND